MKNFRRSLRYLWPYRSGLALALACVLVIAILWGGGLGAMLPGAKILISEEGLHGWAYGKLSEDLLGGRLTRRLVPPAVQIEGQSLARVLEVVALDADGPAAGADLRKTNWVVGLADGDPTHRLLGAEAMAEALAQAGAGADVVLRVYDQDAAAVRGLPVRLGAARASSRLLGWVAGRVRKAEGRPGRFRILLGLLAFVAAITLLRNLLRFVQEYLVGTAVMRGLMDLRCDNYDVVLRLPTTFFSEKGVTDTMSRFLKDTTVLARGQVTLFGKTLAEPAKAVASVAVAMLFSWQLTLIALLAGPPAFLLIRGFGRVMRKASRRALEAWSSMLGVLEETLTGIRVVKAYTMEGGERKRFFQVNRRLLKQQRRIVRTEAAVAPTVEALGIVAAMGAVALAGFWILQGRYNMDSERFLALMGCLAAMFDPVRKLAKVATRFQRAEAAAARIFQLQDQQQETHLPNAPMLPRHCRNLEFRGVRFRYPSAAEDALRDTRLTIGAGETVAIVGANGSGKTTLVSLVPRLLDPSAGAVLIDGRDVSQYSLRSLRRQIGLVTQETVLFHATIAENIAYGLRRPQAQAVLAAAEKAFVNEFVRDLPEGYETMVGEHGATLSGGQRQRIAIARAILRDPAILIFDEATSQVDSDSERRIQQAMAEFIKGRTTLLIAHRFATIRQAGRIVVLNAGRIADIGTHQELLRRCALYRQLYQTQFAPNEEA